MAVGGGGGGSRFLEKSVINFTARLLLDLLFYVQTKRCCSAYYLFTNVFSLIHFVHRFFNSVLFHG